ncbi:sodium-dependent glucose transporter 1A [Galendromus occidentalis]|uniref:Major facilitator superfamily domain-containing protein 4A n=1 Tax=Galendromus occidentalis TaxID=34638 RepID=A0AAJ6QS45_9ACAR|nr:sodium-dependent glucose transporter 1A [Galendromus occidentalis]
MISKSFLSPEAIRWFQTFNLNIGVFSIGLCIAVFGVSFIDLAEIYHVDVDSVVYIISTRSVGSIVACLAGGYVFSKINGQVLVLASTFIGGVALAVVPVCPSLLWTHVACFVLGACVGLIEIGANVWLIVLWKERGASILQFYHFVFGTGAVLAPFIAEPYLSRKISPSAELLLESLNETESHLDEFIPSRVHFPYGYFGAAFVFSAFLMLLAYLVNSENFSTDDEAKSKRLKLSKRVEFLIVSLMCSYVMLGVALEQTYSSLCTIYVVDNLGFSKTSAAYLAAVFWGSFTVSRIFSTILSIKLEPIYLIVINHILLMLAAITLTLFPLTEMVIWSMTGVFAFSLSPFFGNVCGWALKYIVICHEYMSAIIVSVCIGAMLPPITIGPFIQKHPMSFMYANLAAVFLISLNAAAFVCLGRYLSPSESRKDKVYDPVETSEKV